MLIELWYPLRLRKEDPIPEWHCPYCEGLLTSIPGEYVTSDKWFQRFLKCTRCSEVVFFFGKIVNEYSGYYPSLSDYFHEEYIDIYYPKYFNPTLPFFKIPPKCPAEIREMIDECFLTFWISPFLCAFNIRITLEQVLKLNQNEKGKSGKLTLKKRIINFKTIDPETSNALLKNSWLTGESIGEKPVPQKELLSTFYSLERVVNAFY